MTKTRRLSRACVKWSIVSGAVCLALLVGVATTGYAQRVFTSQRLGWYRMLLRFPEGVPDRRFTFARVMCESVTREPRGQGWYTDYPSVDAYAFGINVALHATTH